MKKLELMRTGILISMANIAGFIMIIVLFSKIKSDIFKHSMVIPIMIAIVIIIVTDIIVGIYTTRDKVITTKQIVFTVSSTIVAQILVIGFMYLTLTLLGHLIIYILVKILEGFAHELSKMG